MPQKTIWKRGDSFKEDKGLHVYAIINGNHHQVYKKKERGITLYHTKIITHTDVVMEDAEYYKSLQKAKKSVLENYTEELAQIGPPPKSN